ELLHQRPCRVHLADADGMDQYAWRVIAAARDVKPHARMQRGLHLSARLCPAEPVGGRDNQPRAVRDVVEVPHSAQIVLTRRATVVNGILSSQHVAAS